MHRLVTQAARVAHAAAAGLAVRMALGVHLAVLVTSMHFKARSGGKLADAKLQAALGKLRGNFVGGRAECMLEPGNFEEIRATAAAVRNRAVDIQFSCV